MLLRETELFHVFVDLILLESIFYVILNNASHNYRGLYFSVWPTPPGGGGGAKIWKNIMLWKKNAWKGITKRGKMHIFSQIDLKFTKFKKRLQIFRLRANHLILINFLWGKIWNKKWGGGATIKVYILLF